MTKRVREPHRLPIDDGLRSMTIDSAAGRNAAAGIAAIFLFLLGACGSHSPMKPRIAGQISDDYRPEQTRAVVIARVDVTTDGRPGFGPISNPMLLQFDEGEGVPKERVRDLTIPDLNALSIDDPDSPYYTGAYGPMLWRYAEPGLLAVSIRPGIYDAMIVFYPDTLRLDRPVDSIPAADRPMIFAPLRMDAGAVVYIGDIEVKQRLTWIDLMLDRVKMDYEIVDRYDETAADFRARYPQFQNVKIEKRLPAPIAVCE